MARYPHYDVLFEPVSIGPVTAPNRFYQAPHWTRASEEQPRIRARLLELGVRVETGTVVESLGVDKAVLACAYTGRRREVEAASAVLVTSRVPFDALYHELVERIDIVRIGDCLAAGTIGTAVYSGHRCAREMD